MEVLGDNTPNTSQRPAAAGSGSARAWKRLTHWFTPGRLVIIVIVIMVIGLLIDVIISRGAEGAALTKGTQPDASVFISTLILIYTVFMAVYGTLLPMFIARERGAWEWLALALMLLAIGVNLWRILNSLGDLYTTSMGRLTANKIHDAGYEFTHYYFFSNVVVIVIALLVISLPRSATTGSHPSSDRRR
jgi:uncharacterized membrane protein